MTREYVIVELWPLSDVEVPDPTLAKCPHFQDDATGWTLIRVTGTGKDHRRIGKHLCEACAAPILSA